jgi:Zn-dependent M28 family amino/carboxypeptidase
MIREHQSARRLVTNSLLADRIEHLCDSLCEGRGSGQRGGGIAGLWLQRGFERIGLMKMSGGYAHAVPLKDSIYGRNIIGMLAGSKATTRDRYVIVGAHYDHLGTLNGKTYPGADANASGTVALINLAEMLMGIRNYGKSHNYNIIFVAFDGKEQSMAGSYAFWKLIEEGALTDPQTGKVITREKITLMVNIDQIGSTMSPLSSRRKDYMIMLGNESVKPNKRELLHSCNKQFGIDLDLDLTYYGSHDFTKMFYRLSDQRVFVDNGIPAVLFTSGITMNTNKTWDTPETIDIEVFKKRIFLMYHWIEKMIQ